MAGALGVVPPEPNREASHIRQIDMSAAPTTLLELFELLDEERNRMIITERLGQGPFRCNDVEYHPFHLGKEPPGHSPKLLPAILRRGLERDIQV